MAAMRRPKLAVGQIWHPLPNRTSRTGEGPLLILTEPDTDGLVKVERNGKRLYMKRQSIRGNYSPHAYEYDPDNNAKPEPDPPKRVKVEPVPSATEIAETILRIETKLDTILESQGLAK